MSIPLLVPSSPKAKHLSPVSQAVRWFGASGPGCAESCWAPEGCEPCKVDHHWRSCKSSSVQLYWQALPSPPAALTASARVVFCTCSWSRQAKEMWCFWQDRGKHCLFRLCFPHSGGSWAARAALVTLLPAGCPCAHGLYLRLGPSDCIYTAKQKLDKHCRLSRPDTTQADHSSFSWEG